MKYLKNLFVLYGTIAGLFLLEIGTVSYFLLRDEDCPVCENDLLVTKLEDTEEIVEDKKNVIYVDVKGYVKKPGVYELTEGAIVNDAINLAGGLKSSGTTENINLSKKLIDETMIVVLSKSELKKISSCETTTNSVITQNDQSSDKAEVVTNTDNKISINTATKEELMTLSGIGDKTADKIIEYRSSKRFETIENLKDVSGIGDSLFEKIKDLITV